MPQSQEFGQPITLAKANEYFMRYVKLKEKHGNSLRQCLKNDPEAQRYFCGRNGQSPGHEDWAYIFSPESLTRLLDLIKKTGANSLVIFQGTRNKQQDDPQTESDGRPTLLVFPAKRVEKEREEEYVLENDGEEHPGTGSGVGGPAPLSIPTSFPASRIHKYL